MATREKYSKEFKLDAISLVNEQGYSKADDLAFRGKGALTSDQLEIRQLREENRKLKMEREILKKATVFFAKETK